MTLDEAFKLQKKELIGLKRELAAYKKSSFPLKEKQELEKEIRKGERRYASLKKQFDDLADRHLADSRKIERLEKDLESEQIRSITLQQQNDSLQLELEKVRAELDELKGINRSLTVQLNKDFTNSSFASSAKPFRKKIPNSRKKSGKKPGGQPGHKGHCRKLPLSDRSETVFLPDPVSIEDPDYYKTGRKIHKRLVDISVLVHVTDFCANEFRRRSNGSRIHAPFPSGIINEINYGPGIKAAALLLNDFCNVSVAKTSAFLSSLTGNTVCLSAGMISGLAAQLSARSASDRLSLFQQLTEAGTLYTDATSANVNGEHKTVFISTDKDCALYQIRNSKGHTGIPGTPLEKFRGTAVHDHDRTFYSYAVHHQECLAHVLRYLQGSIDNEPFLKWNRKMQSLLKEMIHFAKKHPEERYPENPKVREFRKRYRSILLQGKDEYAAHPPAEGYREGFNLCTRMLEYMDSHLYFLSDKTVDWTNNISERGLRKFKRKQKQAVAFRSLSGVTDYCNVLSIIETAKLRKQDPYKTIQNIFKKGTINID